MPDKYITISDLTSEECLSYQRLTRAVSCLRKAGLISPKRGKNNEIQMTEAQAMLVRSLAKLIRRDFGVQKAVNFLTTQMWRKQLELYENRIDALLEAHPDYRDALEKAKLLGDDIRLTPEQVNALVQRFL